MQFGGECGPDLADVAQHTGLSPEGVIERFTGAVYEVYFVGFSPGFPYLGGLPPELATPRLSAPRKAVPEGSVAIGGHRPESIPSIRPVDGESWTHSLRLFDAAATPPALLRIGDAVRFVATPESRW